MPKAKRLSVTPLMITVLAALPIAGAGTALAGQNPAAKTWTVKPGGTFSGASAGAIKITDTTLKVTISCKSSSIGGTLKSGSGLPAGIGTITSSTVKGGTCGIGSGLARSAVNWSLTAVSYNATTGVTSGSIGRVHVAVSVGGCTLTVDGTSATANDGTVKITYTNSTHHFKILPNTGNLHIYHPSPGCGGVLHNGDGLSEAVTYNLTPAQKITSP